MGDQMKFTVVNQDGEERECEVLFTFENAETKTNYIVYTDNSLDEDGNTQVFASIFDPDGDMSELRPIETEAEMEGHRTHSGRAAKRVIAGATDL